MELVFQWCLILYSVMKACRDMCYQATVISGEEDPKHGGGDEEHVNARELGENLGGLEAGHDCIYGEEGWHLTRMTCTRCDLLRSQQICPLCLFGLLFSKELVRD